MPGANGVKSGKWESFQPEADVNDPEESPFQRMRDPR